MYFSFSTLHSYRYHALLRLTPSRPQYYKKMAASPSHIIELDDGKFEALLLTPGAKRSFPVVIYFTATNPKYGCQPCQ